MADVAIRIEEAFQGTETGKTEELVNGLITGFQKLGKALASTFKGGKGLENRMESYRYDVASRIPYHCEHV